ncbi:fungal-specific transcription factor domain-containing protein [Paraphoma chrysanthemicola]|nr:fungal-specific transcription factor domain-containing protein [Paraphoma chrysanthemicola]
MPDQWTCDQCAVSFQRREHYQRHLRVHTKEKPFACSFCGNSFGRVDSLARHHNSHHMDPASQTALLQAGERARVSRACKRCSAAKVRCDGKRPCEKCSLAGTDCVYEPPKRKNAKPSVAEPQPKRHSSTSQLHSTTPEVPECDPLASSEQSLLVDVIDPQICGPSIVNDVAIPDFMQFDFFSFPRAPGLFSSAFSDDWMSPGLDIGLWPAPFDLEQENQLLQSIHRAEGAPISTQIRPSHSVTYQLPPTPASDIAELFSRSHTPILDKDAVDIRQYHATSIEVDAPLSFPDLGDLSLTQADQEDFAHVLSLTAEKAEAIGQLIEEGQTQAHYPAFNMARLPAQPIINAWIQLYFEYFHPVFPILHKASFSTPDTHPLLVLVVAAIGAQFSNLKKSLECASSLHELVRRLASRQCEHQNKNGRTVWMTQVILLNSIAMSHSGERRALEVAEILQAVPVALARRKGLLEDVLTHTRIEQLQLPLEQTWRLWAMDEERRRTGFGVWLNDSAFRSDFNLTSVMESSELRNSLPQSDQRWEAIRAQSWVSYPPCLGSGRMKTLAETAADDSWLSIWTKTGTIGKQVILQELMDRVRPVRSLMPYASNSSSEREHAKRILESILEHLEQEDDVPVLDLKALTVHKVICLSALMLCSSPAVDVSSVALSHIYSRLDQRQISEATKLWRAAEHQGREVIAHAARLFEAIRTNHTTHYSMPVHLCRAVLTMWIYSLLSESSDITGSSSEQENSASILLGSIDADGVQIREWIVNGKGRIKLPGMANLLCANGRHKLLEEAIVAMRSLKSWGVSKGYLQLLKRLKAKESASS